MCFGKSYTLTGYQKQFEKLVSEIKKNGEYAQDQTIDNIKNIAHIIDFESPEIRQPDTQYTRHYIGREHGNNKHELMLNMWNKGNKSSIHGHPPLVCYYVVSGTFEMRFFEKIDTQKKLVKHTKTSLFKTGDYMWDYTPTDQFDNVIHQIECIDSGCIMHLYSDDALQGLVFTEV